MTAAVQLHPTEIQYREHDIKLVHRPKVNDWYYEVKHTRTITLRAHYPRYAAALEAAKCDIDALMGDK
jgi:hypothetical protein